MSTTSFSCLFHYLYIPFASFPSACHYMILAACSRPSMVTQRRAIQCKGQRECWRKAVHAYAYVSLARISAGNVLWLYSLYFSLFQDTQLMSQQTSWNLLIYTSLRQVLPVSSSIWLAHWWPIVLSSPPGVQLPPSFPPWGYRVHRKLLAYCWRACLQPGCTCLYLLAVWGGPTSYTETQGHC